MVVVVIIFQGKFAPHSERKESVLFWRAMRYCFFFFIFSCRNLKTEKGSICFMFEKHIKVYTFFSKILLYFSLLEEYILK